MKFSKNFPKISPEEFAHARDSIRIVDPKHHMKALAFNNNNEIPKEYLGKIHNFSARLNKE